MKNNTVTKQFLPIGETDLSIYGFLYKTAGARKNKYAVTAFPNRGEILVLFTFASSYEEAFQIAKSAYEASTYPKVNVSHFAVHGICQSSTCHCGGEIRIKKFPLDWATTR